MAIAQPLSDYQLLAYDELDSTNEEAKRLARQGGAHGTVVWAKRQWAGRGRMDRDWESKEGNLFASFLLQPGCDIGVAAQISLVAALAARDTAVQILPDSAIHLKWPNDLLIGGRKAAGILLESFTPPDRPQLAAVAGIGINVDSYPKNALFPATCLKEEGVELVSAKIVLARLIENFVQRYNLWARRGLAPIRREWLRHAWMLGEEVRVELPDRTLSGIFKDIEPGGSLVLQIGRGQRQVIPAGDLFSLRMAAEVQA